MKYYFFCEVEGVNISSLEGKQVRNKSTRGINVYNPANILEGFLSTILADLYTPPPLLHVEGYRGGVMKVLMVDRRMM